MLNLAEISYKTVCCNNEVIKFHLQNNRKSEIKFDCWDKMRNVWDGMFKSKNKTN